MPQQCLLEIAPTAHSCQRTDVTIFDKPLQSMGSRNVLGGGRSITTIDRADWIAHPWSSLI